MIKDLSQLPDDLPVPLDDGACNHLQGMNLPSILLQSTSRLPVDLSNIGGLLVIYFYPMNGHPASPPMIGWNAIPGARGCTPQACAFRDIHAELVKLGATVVGISSQPSKDQKEVCTRLALPFDLLSDENIILAHALELPTSQNESVTYIKRITLIIKNGVIQKVFYPVFPPDQNPVAVRDWLRTSSLRYDQ